MKYLFLMSAAVIGLSVASVAAIAGDHGHDHKGKMMEKVDTDGDGKISKEEFMAKHEKMFTKMDVDGDGYLSKEEMKNARTKMHDKMKKMHDKHEDKAAE